MLVLFLENGLSLPLQSFRYATLNHPRGHSVVYLINNNKFFELQRVQNGSKYSSFFVDQRVLGGDDTATFYLANKIDLRYFIIPFLQKNASRFSPLDQIVRCGEEDSRDDLKLEYIDTSSLEEICEVNNKFDDMILYRYNESKLLDWLGNKVSKVSLSLATINSKSDLTYKQLYSSNFISLSAPINTSSSSAAAAISEPSKYR